MPLIVHPDLQSLIPPLTREEYAQLEANILKDGCHDALIVWQEEQCLLDGHNRRTICEQHGVDYRIQELSLPDLDAAKAWIIANQLGRSNLIPEQMSYFRGKQYEMKKQQGKCTDLTSRKNGEKFTNIAPTLATMHKVGVRTIERDGAYARAVDAIAEVAGPEARQALLARETKITQQEVKQLADVARVSPKTAKEVVKAVQLAKTPKAAKQMVQLAVEAAQKQVATVGSGTLTEAGVPRATLARLALKPAAPKVAKAARAPAVQETVPEQPLHGEVVPTSMIDKVLSEALGNIEILEAYARATPGLFELHREAYDALKDACLRLIKLLDPEAPPAPPKIAPQGRSPDYGKRTQAVEQMARKLHRFTCPEIAKHLGDDRRAVKLVLTRKVKQGMVKKEGTVYTWVGPTPSVTEAS